MRDGDGSSVTQPGPRECQAEAGNAVVAEAVESLRQWGPQVRDALARLSVPDRRVAVRGLAAWYTRVSHDDSYAGAPPLEGMDTVVDALAGATLADVPFRRLARARWAIRVGEAVVVWRRCREGGGDGIVAMDAVQDDLHVVLAEASRQFGTAHGAGEEERGPS